MSEETAAPPDRVEGNTVDGAGAPLIPSPLMGEGQGGGAESPLPLGEAGRRPAGPRTGEGLRPEGQASISLQINGAEHQLRIANQQTLLALLRDGLGLKSVREGCGVGICGTCTVLLDGRPISSCLTLAVMAEGHEVLTVEGLGLPGQLHLVQEAFIAASGFQCSYCTPGVILTVKALLAEHPEATDAEIRDYLAGNLCRCGSYVKILDAVHDALRRMRA